MYRFWDAITKPLLDILQPETILEVGSDFGPNTRYLADFCRQRDAKLYVIDPLPKYDVSEWQERYGENIEFHTALSLDVLPKIEKFDVVLIDGDHNWYTVFNELKLIEKRCHETDQLLPLVLLHDVGWPYGRRDGYYAPGQIPNHYRNPYEQKGMGLDSERLLEEGGFNQGFRNAVHEGGPYNGVLTAVEDFVDQAEQEMEIVVVHGLHGLGILVPIHLKQSGELREFLKALELSSAMASHLESVEKSRLETEIDWQQRGVTIRRLKVRQQREIEALKTNQQKQVENLRMQNREARQLLELAKQREKRTTEQLTHEGEQSRDKRRGPLYYLRMIVKKP